VSPNKASISGADQISVTTAYIAMYRFVEAYWERGKRRDGSVTLLCSDLTPYVEPKVEGAIWTSDPAFWNDWLEAITIAVETGPLENPDPGR
jgi:hypothetical protein